MNSVTRRLRHQNRNATFVQHYSSDRFVDQKIQEPKRFTCRSAERGQFYGPAGLFITPLIGCKELHSKTPASSKLRNTLSIVQARYRTELDVYSFEDVENWRNCIIDGHGYSPELRDVYVSCLDRSIRNPVAQYGAVGLVGDCPNEASSQAKDAGFPESL